MIADGDFLGFRFALARYKEITKSSEITVEQVDKLAQALLDAVKHERKNRDGYLDRFQQEQCMADFLRRHLADYLHRERKQQEGYYY